MSVSLRNYSIDTDSETDDLIELQTLPRSSSRKYSEKSENIMAASTVTQTPNKKQEKRGLKERIFGTKRPSKGSTKFDVVRNVEILNYTQRTDDIHEREVRKASFGPVRTSFIHGHKFDPHNKPTWCDVCEDFIWGLYTQAMRCQYCRYTCHMKCLKYVLLDCPKAPSIERTREDLMKEASEIFSESNGTVNLEKKNNNLPEFVKSTSQLTDLIKEYNEKSSLIMTLHDDYTFDGFIRVHMNLNRPVNISSDVSSLTLKKAVMRTKSGKAKRPLSHSRRPVTELFPDATEVSSYDDSGLSSQSSTLSSVDTSTLPSSMNVRKEKRINRRLSFYMPKGTYKPLHVTSTTTAREVIEALLSKYNVTDNPKKFALYEKYSKTEGGENENLVYRKLQDEEHPLVLCLSWGGKNSSRTFALKEDEDGHIQWMSFEVPELKNFLKILQMEEDELMAQIYQKYENYRDALKKAIDSKAIDFEYTSEA